jgi:hypothetical protein
MDRVGVVSDNNIITATLASKRSKLPTSTAAQTDDVDGER